MIIDMTISSFEITQCYHCKEHLAVHHQSTWHESILYEVFLCDECIWLEGDWIGSSRSEYGEMLKVMCYQKVRRRRER